MLKDKQPDVVIFISYTSDSILYLKTMKALAPQLAVIMMTAFARDDLAEEARRAAALAVLPKPLDMERLLALLTQVARSEGPTGDARHERDRRRPDAVPFE